MREPFPCALRHRPAHFNFVQLLLFLWRLTTNLLPVVALQGINNQSRAGPVAIDGQKLVLAL